MTAITGLNTEDAINAAYITAHAEAANRSWYRKLIAHEYVHSLFGGGRYYLEGYKDSDSYGWQNITSYHSNEPVNFYRSLSEGTWTDWKRLPTRAEIDAMSSKLPTASPKFIGTDDQLIVQMYYSPSINSLSVFTKDGERHNIPSV